MPIKHLSSSFSVLAAALLVSACNGGSNSTEPSEPNELIYDNQGVFKQQAAIAAVDVFAQQPAAGRIDSVVLYDLMFELESAAANGKPLNFSPETRLKKRNSEFQRQASASDELICALGGTYSTQVQDTEERYTKKTTFNQCVIEYDEKTLTLNGSFNLLETFFNITEFSKETEHEEWNFNVTGHEDNQVYLAISGHMATHTKASDTGKYTIETKTPRFEIRSGDYYAAVLNRTALTTIDGSADDGGLQTEINGDVGASNLGGYLTVKTPKALILGENSCPLAGVLRVEGHESHYELRFGADSGTAAFGVIEMSDGQSLALDNCDNYSEWAGITD